MIKNLPSLQKLIKLLQKIPYLASKNVYRVAVHLVSSKSDDLKKFCQTLIEAKNNIQTCSVCFNLTEGKNICSICSSEKRNKSIICVVETWHDLFAIERTSGYEGIYHILGGSLCPLEGIGIDELNFKSLLNRIDGTVKEVIFATNSTPEGEATASFISSKISENNPDIIISRLASGLPIGSNLEYMDRVTIYKALSGRCPF